MADTLGPMDRTISWLPTAKAPDPLESALREVNAAIALVVAGVAVTITLCCLDAAEAAAFTGAVWAQAAGVAFRIRRDSPSAVSLVIGPRLRAVPVETDAETGS
jgi:hypothetical protein